MTQRQMPFKQSIQMDLTWLFVHAILWNSSLGRQMKHFSILSMLSPRFPVPEAVCGSTVRSYVFASDFDVFCWWYAVPVQKCLLKQQCHTLFEVATYMLCIYLISLTAFQFIILTFPWLLKARSCIPCKRACVAQIKSSPCSPCLADVFTIFTTCFYDYQGTPLRALRNDMLGHELLLKYRVNQIQSKTSARKIGMGSVRSTGSGLRSHYENPTPAF